MEWTFNSTGNKMVHSIQARMDLFIPVKMLCAISFWHGMVYSIPIGMELSIAWNGLFHSSWSELIHISQSGMDYFNAARVYWTISFLLEGNYFFILVSFVPYCHRTSCLTVLSCKLLSIECKDGIN